MLPEYFGIFGARATDKVAARERDGDGPQQAFLAAAARQHGIWLVGGTVPLACGDPARVRSACLVYGPDGQRVARYDKIHLFAFARGDETLRRGQDDRARQPAGGDRPALRSRRAVDLLRPALSRALPRRWATLALILVPAAFTATTGAAHWHLLLRARAVENQCYVLAAAQGGLHPGGRRTYGHSAADRPVGAIVAERDERGPASSSATSIRRGSPRCATQLPALAHRVLR